MGNMTPYRRTRRGIGSHGPPRLTVLPSSSLFPSSQQGMRALQGQRHQTQGRSITNAPCTPTVTADPPYGRRGNRVKSNTNRPMSMWSNWNRPAIRPYDYWLSISTLEKGSAHSDTRQTLAYHKSNSQTPKAHERRSSSTLVCNSISVRACGETALYDEEVTVQTPPDAPVVGIDVGITNSMRPARASTGSFHKDRARGTSGIAPKKAAGRPEIARGCLQKKVQKKLPSTSSPRSS